MPARLEPQRRSLQRLGAGCTPRRAAHVPCRDRGDNRARPDSSRREPRCAARAPSARLAQGRHAPNAYVDGNGGNTGEGTLALKPVHFPALQSPVFAHSCVSPAPHVALHDVTGDLPRAVHSSANTSFGPILVAQHTAPPAQSAAVAHVISTTPTLAMHELLLLQRPVEQQIVEVAGLQTAGGSRLPQSTLGAVAGAGQRSASRSSTGRCKPAPQPRPLS